MAETPDFSPFDGDIAARDTLKVNRKGGSQTATLKKSVQTVLGDTLDHLNAAALQFERLGAVLLVDAARAESERVSVTRTGPNRFVVQVEADDSPEVDDLTAAFLMLRTKAMENGTLTLSGPVGVEDWQAMTAGLDQPLDPASGD